MLDIHRLRVFRAVVASGSVQAAAGNLGFTSSAVSQQVSALQRETGLTLLTRVGRGVEPTAAGRLLAAEVDGVLARLGEVETMVGDLRAGRSGSLSLAYFSSVGSAWMPQVVARLLAEHPALRLDLTLLEELSPPHADRPDLQVVVDRVDMVAPPGTVNRHLVDDPYVVALPAKHPLAGEEVVELAALAGEGWVDNDYSRGWCRRVLLDACRAAGFAPTFRVEAHDYASALAFVAAGLGPTVLPSLGAVRVPSEVRVVALTNPTPVRPIHVIATRAALAEPPAQTALQALVDLAGRQPG